MKLKFICCNAVIYVGLKKKTFKIKLNDISNLILCTCKCDAEAYTFPHGQGSIFGKSVTLKMTEECHRVHLIEVAVNNLSWLLNLTLYVISTSYRVHLIVNSVDVHSFNDPLICHFIVGALNTSIEKLSAIYNSTSGILWVSSCSLRAWNLYA